MVDAAKLEALDAVLNVNMAAGLAGLSLVTFTFLLGRVKDLEQEAGVIKVKRGGADSYAAAMLGDLRRMRWAARLVIIATVLLLLSAILMLVAFDTFAETSIGAGDSTAAIWWDVAVTGATFLFGLVALLLATLALGWDVLTR